MKLRKVLSAVIMGALCAGALAVNASAATYDLTMPTIDIGVTQTEWFTNGTDNLESDLTLEMLTSATQFVVELSSELTQEQIDGGSGALVFFGDGNGWDWAGGQNDYMLADVVDGNKLVFNLEGMKGREEIKAGPNAKFAFANYFPDFDEMGVVRFYLDGIPEAAPEAGSTDAPAADSKGSADTGIEGVAIIAGIAIVAGGAVIISKKRK